MNWDRIEGNWKQVIGKAKEGMGQAHRRRSGRDRRPPRSACRQAPSALGNGQGRGREAACHVGTEGDGFMVVNPQRESLLDGSGWRVDRTSNHVDPCKCENFPYVALKY